MGCRLAIPVTRLLVHVDSEEGVGARRVRVHDVSVRSAATHAALNDVGQVAGAVDHLVSSK